MDEIAGCSGASSSNNSTLLTFIHRNGGQILLRAGYQYSKKRVNKNGSTKWRCVDYRKKCKGSLCTSSEGNISEEQAHTVCEPNLVRNDLAVKMEMVREKVMSTQDKISTIYNEAIEEYEDSGLSLIEIPPKLDAHRSKYYKIRNKHAGVSKMHFKNLNEVEVPRQFKEFLLAEFHDDTLRIFVFCSLDMRKRISNFEHIFVDGTFRSCPAHFSELYVLMGDTGSTSTQTHVVPVMYALLSRRNKEAYKRLYQIIKTELPDFHPSTFTLDFEQAAIASLREEFPQARIKGCYFHFTQAVWKRGKDLKLTKCSETRRTVALSAMLPLLPKEHIDEAWTYITENAIITGEITKGVDDFINYMMNQWLTSDDWIEVWNVNKEIHRTNNVTEAWNGRLNKLIPKKQPTLMMLLKVLENDSKHASKLCTQRDNNKPKLAKYISRDRWITYVLEQLENNTITVGHCLEKLRK